MDTPLAIKTIGLTKAFTRNKKVISGVDLSVNKGELFCLVGDNGAGKTTLIKILCSLILPTSGEVFIDGHDLLREKESARACIGLVTGDERSFYWRLTGRQNLEFFAALYGFSRAGAKARIKKLLDILGIEEPHKQFQEYPSGIKQRLSIARALLNNPEVIFIDELTKSLDPTSARYLRRFIKERLVGEQGKTVFFSTHQLYEVEELADRIAFMSQGRIRAAGGLDELRHIIGGQHTQIEDIYSHFINKKD